MTSDKFSDSSTGSSDNSDSRSVEALLESWAELERSHEAPVALRESIRQTVHTRMRQVPGTPVRRPRLQVLLDWLGAHWWRMAPISATAAAIPLLTGLLLGSQLFTEEDVMIDPASEWLASYATSVAAGDLPGADEDLP